MEKRMWPGHDVVYWSMSEMEKGARGEGRERGRRRRGTRETTLPVTTGQSCTGRRRLYQLRTTSSTESEERISRDIFSQVAK